MSKSGPSPEQIEANFAPIHPPFDPEEARAQASRCIFCWDAPCTRACPTHIDVPRFIRQVLHGNAGGAAETILSANILGGTCARVCPTEVLCEGACVDRTLHGGPIPIGQIQRYAVDWADERGMEFFEAGPDTGRKVAIVGAGPSGLACAHALRLQGHAATLFEARGLAGGLGATGIARYKITQAEALAEVARIEAVGAEIRVNSPVSPEALAQMHADYDAVFVGVGLGNMADLGLPGEDAPGVWDALDFIAQLHAMPLAECEVGRRVAVIGGGNSAIDAASQAKRLGAEQVILIYRRDEGAMPAYRHEVELARAAGVQFEWLAAPVRFHEENGRVSGLTLQRLESLGEGRGAELRPVAGETFSIHCDMAIKAVGQKPHVKLLRGVAGLAFEHGRLVVDPATCATSLPGLYAGGDCISGGAELVDAVAQGKVAAASIGEYLAAKGGRS